MSDSKNNRRFGCLMLDLMMFNYSSHIWTDTWAELINQDDLHPEEGIESDPHTTILYGVHEEVHGDDVLRVMPDTVKGMEIIVSTLSYFDNPNFDVLKFEIDDDKLKELHELVKSSFPHTLSFPDYKPHITVAYLKKGRAQKYIDMWADGYSPLTFYPTGLTYSNSDKSKTTTTW